MLHDPHESDKPAQLCVGQAVFTASVPNSLPLPTNALARPGQDPSPLEQATWTPAGLDERYRVEVQRFDRVISSLERISRALGTTTEGVEVLLKTIAETIAQVYGSSFVFIFIKSGYKQRRAVYRAGSEPENGAESCLRDHVPCFDDRALAEPGLIRVQRLIADHRPCLQLGDIVSVPMLRDGKPEGCICLQVDASRALDEYDAATLQALANQAVIAIQNATLFEESLYLRAQSDELYRIAVQQKNEAERKQVELQAALDEIDSMEREQIIGAERERIARELHDDVAQILFSIGLNLEWCRQRLPSDSPVQERIALLKQLARNGLFEVRNAILGLSAANISEIGLANALERLVTDFEQISRITVRFQAEGEPRQLPFGVGNALYYIAQEALYNILKHAQTREADVRLFFESEAATLTVSDNGVGIDNRGAGEGRAAMAFGIKNMHTRAEELGGSLLIGRGAAGGTRITARIPG